MCLLCIYVIVLWKTVIAFMSSRLTAIRKGVCACVRLTGTRILLEWPVSFSPGVSVLECAFLVAVFDVCMCWGAGGEGGSDSSLLTAKTTASSDTAPAPVCLPCWPLVKSGQRLHGSAAGSADKRDNGAGNNGPGPWPRVVLWNNLLLAPCDVMSVPCEEVTVLPSPVCV